MFGSKIKKFLILISAVFTISLFSFTSIKAQGSDTYYLQLIAYYTYYILYDVNTLPSALQQLMQMALAWTSPDNSDVTSTMQGTFTQLGNLLTREIASEASLQPMLNNDLLNNDQKNITNANMGGPNTGSGLANPDTLGYANDLVYSTLLGSPYYRTDPRAAKQKSVNPPYNYIKNAAGINSYHPIPGSWMRGSDQSIQRYQIYFNTVMAVESFSGYVLSHQYADGNQFNTLQTTLIQQATDPKNWFTKVASENIGFVLRQLLLYESQAFVLFTQMVQLQKQAVAAQAMTNTLLIMNNQLNETVMVANAAGTKPTA